MPLQAPIFTIKPKTQMKKVMVFGVFDLLHPGHINFLKQARKLGDSLIVSVARDKNVKRVKGKLPIQKEKQRLNQILKLSFVDKAILGASGNPWPHIKKEKPNVFALGYDQANYVTKPTRINQERGTKGAFQRELMKKGINAKVIRLKRFKSEIFKSSIIKKKGLKSK